jgi:hypothetical protein
MPVQAEPLAEHRPDVPQCVGDARCRGSKTSEEHYVVIYIVPREPSELQVSDTLRRP